MMRQRRDIAFLALLLAVLAYYLPWVHHPAASLSPGARDLAEWTTLLPAMRTGVFPLAASFFLRLSFGTLVVLVAWLAACYKSVITRLVIIGLALGMVLTMLPPVDFFLSPRADPNYQQQFFLSLITLAALIAALVTIHDPSTRVAALVPAIAALVAIVCALLGFVVGAQLFRAASIAPSIGPGVVLFVIAMLVTEIQTLRFSHAGRQQ